MEDAIASLAVESFVDPERRPLWVFGPDDWPDDTDLHFMVEHWVEAVVRNLDDQRPASFRPVHGGESGIDTVFGEVAQNRWCIDVDDIAVVSIDVFDPATIDLFGHAGCLLRANVVMADLVDMGDGLAIGFWRGGSPRTQQAAALAAHACPRSAALIDFRSPTNPVVHRGEDIFAVVEDEYVEAVRDDFYRDFGGDES